jgi:hypothetical protein
MIINENKLVTLVAMAGYNGLNNVNIRHCASRK